MNFKSPSVRGFSTAGHTYRLSRYGKTIYVLQRHGERASSLVGVHQFDTIRSAKVFMGNPYIN